MSHHHRLHKRRRIEGRSSRRVAGGGACPLLRPMLERNMRLEHGCIKAIRRVATVGHGAIPTMHTDAHGPSTRALHSPTRCVYCEASSWAPRLELGRGTAANAHSRIAAQ